MSEHYVYLHRNSETGTPFYVGKGRGSEQKRAKERTARTAYWKDFCASCEFDIEIIAKDLGEDEAFELEEFLIDEIGRADLGAGPLINKTNGGMGMRGYLATENTKQKMSRSLRKVCKTARWKMNQSKSQRQLWESDKHRAKFLGGNNHNARAVLCVETGEIYDSVADAQRAFGKKPRGSMIPKACKDKTKTALGFHWSYLDETAQRLRNQADDIDKAGGLNV